MKDIRICKSPRYNYLFKTSDGFFLRWGKDENDDPKFSPFGPELLDIEISTICGLNCSHCYKSNSSVGKNMSLETYKTILSKMPNIKKLELVLENGEKYYIKNETKVKLKNGSIITGKEIKNEDDIIEIL